MKFRKFIEAKLAILIPTIALLSSLPAHAALFDYTFSFANGSWVSGQLTGTQVGQTVVDISNVSATVNVTGFQESRSNLFVLGYNSATNNWDSTIPVILSTNIYQNNFLFTDTAYQNSLLNTMYFEVSNPSSLASSASAGTTVYMWGVPVASYSTSTFAINQYNGWSLTAVASPVPVPTAAWLFGSGLLELIGMARRLR